MSAIKKDDQVYVTTGKDKGKTGRVIMVLPKEDRVIVETINKVKKAQRPTQANPKGGFVEIEKPIPLSNLMLMDKKSNKPTRFSAKLLKDGGKVRISKESGETL